MLMYYAPWCGFCKQLKPDYSAAATELKPDYVMAAIDVNRPENAKVRKTHNITGFPTLLYYENGEMKFTYEGENNKAGLVAFMRDPTAPSTVKPKESDWASEADTEIVHLTSDNFEAVLKDEKSALVMFHAPCKYCSSMAQSNDSCAFTLHVVVFQGVVIASE